jgi:CO/xanthine dehydrogenase FAD-binding subunit
MVNHFIPTNLIEALDFKSKNNVTVISGATDIMVQRRNWADLPAKFDKKTMFIFNLKELNYIRKIDNHLHIGAVTPMSDILKHPDTPELLKKSIEIIASPALRNCATIAGNIGNASPSGDSIPVLYALDAMIVIESIHGERILPIEEVILDYRKTCLNEEELITEIIIPLEDMSFIDFTKVGGRQADAISKVSFAGCLRLKENKVVALRLAFGAVGPTIIRKNEIEQKYIGLTIAELKQQVNNIIKEYQKALAPINDRRSNKKYREQVALNILKAFIESK